MFQRNSMSITLVGLPLNFNNELEGITAYMKENSETELTIEMNYAQAMFFTKFSKEINVESNILESVEWHRIKGVGIALKGRARNVQKGKDTVRRLLSL